MRSPRFDIRAKTLRAIFSPHNIERIWKEKVKVSMRDQFMCDGIENLDFHVHRKVESDKLSQLILSGDYVPQKAQRILIEKAKDFVDSSSSRAYGMPSFFNAYLMPSIRRLKARRLPIKHFSSLKITRSRRRIKATGRS